MVSSAEQFPPCHQLYILFWGMFAPLAAAGSYQYCQTLIIKISDRMSDYTTQESESPIEERTAEAKQETSFHYQMADMKARKIATLIRFSKLNYSLEEVTEPEARPYLLRTSQGELYEEYEIIGYIVNDSFARGGAGGAGGGEWEEEGWGRCQIFVWAKMNEQLFELRRGLFPLLEEFYRYLLGHERTKKSKYDALSNRIKKEILKLDQRISEHPEVFGTETSFLSVLLLCELFLACKFVFEEKFRKSKYSLFNRCEKISKRPEFEEVYGKASFCVKECLPVEFEEEEEPESRKVEEAIPAEIARLAQPLPVVTGGSEKRNQLLYNFFRSTLKGQESKLSYFPYFWLMYDNLLCTLVELHYCPNDQQYSFPELEKNLTLATQELAKVLKNIDYGFLGVYFNEKDRHYRLQGMVCLGSHSFEEFAEEMGKNGELRQFRALKVDVSSEEERRKVELLWECQTEGASFQGIKVSLLREF